MPRKPRILYTETNKALTHCFYGDVFLPKIPKIDEKEFFNRIGRTEK
jgi:hypothetical protein